MAQPIIFKITQAGKTAALGANGDGAELKINLTQVAIGAGKYTPTGNETMLMSEVGIRSGIVSGDVEVSSNTLRFSSSLTMTSETPIYEIGLFTDDGVLFAVAASTTEPLLTIYPGVTFVAAFGLSLSEVGAGNVTVTTDPNGALSIVLMQQHLAAADPHPQYLNNNRFQLLLNILIPMGYIHNTHLPVNPKPFFDELLGIDTYWRRIVGRIMIASDPNDPFINDYGISLGQKGLTTLASGERPHVYPLQTTHVFERYDPAAVIETVWTIKSNKDVVDEGAVVRFTLSANNIPDGQIIQWVAKEGELNAANNDIAIPEKTQNGTVILRNGQATIDFVTTPDDNKEENLKHVRLTFGAPASLSINVPIADKGFNETVVHITQSTNSGIVLDEYFKIVSGAYPKTNETVRFIVDSGVDIVAPNTSTPAVREGTKWINGAKPIVENRGRILGAGGDGGRSAGLNNGTEPTYSTYSILKATLDLGLTDAVAGGNGGTAIQGSIAVDNYGLIAGGGGGGGGTGAFAIAQSPIIGFSGLSTKGETVGLWAFAPYWGLSQAGTGGGAPYGKPVHNGGSPNRMREVFGADLVSYLPALTANDFITRVYVTPKKPINNLTYMVTAEWHNKTTNVSFPTPPSDGFKPDKTTDIQWKALNDGASSYKSDYYVNFGYPLTENADSYITYTSRDRGYSIRKESVTLATMIADGELQRGYNAKAGTLLAGGIGGINGTSLGFWVDGEYRALSPSRVWRFTNVIKKMPVSGGVQAWEDWYGWTDVQSDAPKMGEAGYTEEINVLAIKGGNGGDVGEDGEAGTDIPKYVITYTSEEGIGRNGEYLNPFFRVLEYYDGMIADDRMKSKPPAQGGRAGLISEGDVVINNIAAGITKGRVAP